MLLLAVSLLLFVDEEKSRLEEKHDEDDSGEEDKGSVVAAATGVTLDVVHVAETPNLALDDEAKDGDTDDIGARPLRREAFLSRQAALILDGNMNAGTVRRSWR